MATARPRRLLRLLAWAAAALLLIVALLPTILSAGFGRSYLAGMLTEEFGEPVEVGSVDLGWFSGASAGGIRAGTLLTLRDGRVEGSLWSILMGKGRLQVAAEGLTLSIEEGAGGRTNLEPLLERLTRPREAPAAPPRRPRPLQVSLKECAVTLRRTPRTPQNPPVDPFVEDPVVLPADANATVIALEGLTLDATVDGERAQATFAGRASLDGRSGTISGSATRDGATVEAKFEAEGIDVAPLGLPFSGIFGGSGSVRVEGERMSGHVTARIADADAFGFAEKWVTLSVDGERDGDAVRVGACSVETASGEIALAASGSYPSEVVAKGRFPARLAAKILGRPPEAGAVEFDLRAASRANLVDLAGSLGLRGFDGPDLDAKLDVTIAPSERSVEIRLLDARAPDVAIRASGSARAGERPTADLTLAADADLARLRRYLGPLVTLPPETRVEGRVKVAAARFVLDKEGDALLDVQARIDGLVAGAIARDSVVISIDTSLEGGGDRLVVRRGEIDRLSIAGSAEGIRERRLRRAEGSVRGALDLDPALARLFGVTDLGALAGTLQVALTASTSQADGILVAGEVKGSGLHVRRPGVDLRQQAVALSLDGVLAGAVASGKGTLVADAISLAVESFRATGIREVEARGRIDVRDLAALRTLLPPGAIPDGIALSGDLAGPFDVRSGGARQEVRATLESKALTAERDGQGVRSEAVRLRLQATRDGDALDLADSALRLGARDAEVVVRRGRIADLARPDRFEADAELHGSLADLALLVPDLARMKPRGQAKLGAKLSQRETLAFDVEGTVLGFSLAPSAKLSFEGTLKLGLRGQREGGDLQLESLAVTLGETTVSAKGRLGEKTDLQLSLRGDGRRLTDLLPGATAEGPVVVTLGIRGSVGGSLPLNGTGDFRCKRLVLPSLDLLSPVGEIRAEARIGKEGLGDLASTALIRAPEARIGTVRIEKAEVNYTGATAPGGGPFEFRTRITADRLLASDLPVEKIDISVAGALATLDAKALDGVILHGSVTFEKASTKTIEVTQGSALIEMRNGVAFLRDFSARARGGTLAGDIEVAFGESPISWKAKVGIADLQLSPAQGRALSFTVPFLRLGGALKEAAALEGLLGARLDLTGSGTDGASIARSLGGKGSLRFKDVAVRGSILLPLLNLRIDQLLSREPYRFQDLDLTFDVKDGRVLTPAYELKGVPFSIHIEGNAGLDGSLDYLVRPSLLPFPLRISGHLDRPKVRPAPLAGFR